MKKCSFLFCVILALVNISHADRYVTSRKTPPRPKSPVVRILETSYLIQKSQQSIDSVELILQQACDIAEASISDSYCQLQREQLDIQFQKLLTLLDPMVEMSEFGGHNLLDSESADIIIRFGRDTLRFEATDITLAGLDLEGAALPAFYPVEPIQLEPTVPIQIPDPPSLITFPDGRPRPPVDPNMLRELLEEINARRADPNFVLIPIRIPITMTPEIPDLPDLDDLPPIQIPLVNLHAIGRETFFKVQAAIRKIKQLRLQFADYHNTLCKYLPYLEPDYTGEVQLGLEIVEASKTEAEGLQTVLERALALANESINGSYSPIHRTIMNIEFRQRLLECTTAAERVYYGMGIIDGQNQLSVKARRQTLEFEGFDLTTAGLGLDGNLSINTIENAQSALPYVASAIRAVQQTVNALAEYEQTLYKLGGYQVTDLGNLRDRPRLVQDRPVQLQSAQVRQPFQHPTAWPVRLEVR